MTTFFTYLFLALYGIHSMTNDTPLTIDIPPLDFPSLGKFAGSAILLLTIYMTYNTIRRSLPGVKSKLKYYTIKFLEFFPVQEKSQK